MKIDFTEYQQIKAVNISLLLELLTSPKQFQHRRLHPLPDTQARRIGRGAHTAILEPMEFLRSYVLSPFEKFTKKKAREWRKEQLAAGKTVLTEGEYQRACSIRDAVLAHPTAARYLEAGAPEHTWTWTWTDARTHILCKGRVDYLIQHRADAEGAIVDLKTTRHVTPQAFARQAANLLYHVRMAWYRDGHLEATGERLPVVIVAVQNEAPWDVACYRVPEEALDAGRRVYEDLLTVLEECLVTDSWPGVAPAGLLDLPLPPWAAGSIDGLALEDESLAGLELEV